MSRDTLIRLNHADVGEVALSPRSVISVAQLFDARLLVLVRLCAPTHSYVNLLREGLELLDTGCRLQELTDDLVEHGVIVDYADRRRTFNERRVKLSLGVSLAILLSAKS